MKEHHIEKIIALLPNCKDESLLDLIYKLLLSECGNNCSDTVVLFCG
jgi:hypothetical protein